MVGNVSATHIMKYIDIPFYKKTFIEEGFIQTTMIFASTAEKKAGILTKDISESIYKNTSENFLLSCTL